jgi:hypothetical protein
MTFVTLWQHFARPLMMLCRGWQTSPIVHFTNSNIWQISAQLYPLDNHPIHSMGILGNEKWTDFLNVRPQSFWCITNVLIHHSIGLVVSQTELMDVYIKEKESFNGNSQALKHWLDELHTVA